MFPFYWKLGPLAVTPNEVFTVIGVVVGALIIRRRLVALGATSGGVLDFILAALGGGAVGARLYYFLPLWFRGQVAFSTLFTTLGDGSGFYGAFVGGSLALALTAQSEEDAGPPDPRRDPRGDPARVRGGEDRLLPGGLLLRPAVGRTASGSRRARSATRRRRRRASSPGVAGPSDPALRHDLRLLAVRPASRPAEAVEAAGRGAGGGDNRLFGLPVRHRVLPRRSGLPHVRQRAAPGLAVDGDRPLRRRGGRVGLAPPEKGSRNTPPQRRNK